MNNDAIAKVLETTDWKMLRDQKQQLVAIVFASNDMFLSGLLNWIDCLQDAAEADGYPVEFLTEEEEEVEQEGQRQRPATRISDPLKMLREAEGTITAHAGVLTFEDGRTVDLNVVDTGVINPTDFSQSEWEELCAATDLGLEERYRDAKPHRVSFSQIEDAAYEIDAKAGAVRRGEYGETDDKTDVDEWADQLEAVAETLRGYLPRKCRVCGDRLEEGNTGEECPECEERNTQ